MGVYQEREGLLIVYEHLCPADESQAAEDLWLDLDGDVEVLTGCAVSDMVFSLHNLVIRSMRSPSFP